MTDIIIQFAILLGLTALNAFFAGAEIAILFLRPFHDEREGFELHPGSRRGARGNALLFAETDKLRYALT